MVQERFSQYLQTTQPRVKIVFLAFVVIKRGINAVGWTVVAKETKMNLVL